ncbi:MAG TPA: DUF4276 family protein [Planctomycetota bacterium]|nr:DUF4276 family protein [Planctomycetota bacterium]
MTDRRIACIVEGDGEVAGLPILLRRIEPDASVDRPWRCPKGKLGRHEELARALEFARRKTSAADLILLLQDADDQAPCLEAPLLLDRARSAAPDRQVRVVMAKREFEAWFLGALPSLRGLRGIAADAPAVAAPEDIRGAKERLGSLMGRRYSPTTDQPAFCDRFDIELARRNCPSFDKLLRDLGH